VDKEGRRRVIFVEKEEMLHGGNEAKVIRGGGRIIESLKMGRIE
jgi:hypothetical protein